MVETKTTRAARRARLIPELKPGKYSDGLPLDELRYLECKIILRPNHFRSREDLLGFARLMRRPARESGVGLATKQFPDEPLQIREVLFVDTADALLYKNGFILRRRIPYRDGFPIGDPEIVFKYRHPDLQKVAEMDVRPRINGDYRIKFKAEALPLKDGLGGIRILYSHNVEFGLSSVTDGDRTSMDLIVRSLPALECVPRRRGQRVELVGGTIVEEVLQDIGTLDFGHGMTAVANVALWRNRGDHRPLIGEFAFQIKFKRRDELNESALARGRAFFVSLQNAAKDWIALGETKTGAVYRLKGTPTHSQE
jgi:hypothetical protein